MVITSIHTLLISNILLHNGTGLKSQSKYTRRHIVWSEWPVYEVKCLCSIGRKDADIMTNFKSQALHIIRIKC